MRSIAAPFLLLLTLSLAGCGGDDGSGTASSFQGTPWILASGVDVPGWEQMPPSATFDEGTVGGSTGCNRFTAPYTVDGDSLELGPVASTRMACPPPANAVERVYLAALERVAGWRTDEELVLVDRDDTELLRYRTPTPVGDWEVAAFLTGDAVQSPLPGTTLTATFSDDEALTGSAGCNIYRATYTTNRGQIEISPPSATEKACVAPEGVMEQESAYLAALLTAVTYRVDGGSLALLSADGTYVVSFTRLTQP